MLVHANAFLAEVPEQIEESYRPSRSTRSTERRGWSRALRSARAASTTAETRGVIEAALADHFSYPNSVCAHPDRATAGGGRRCAVDLSST